MTAARFRVVVVQPIDDRRITRALAGDPATEVVAVTAERERAFNLATRLHPDAFVIDADLPDGAAFEATRRIMAEVPTPIIIAVDDERRGGQAALAALQAGAILVVPKPPEPETPQFAVRRSGLLAAIHAMAPMKLGRRAPAQARPAVEDEPRPRQRAAIVAIAASTGGPAAFCRVLAELPGDFAAPILLTQHMSPGFIEGMVRWLGGFAAVHVKLAEHGEPLRPATVYVAGDDRHLTALDSRTIGLIDAPPTDGHRPSATVMFRSVSVTFGRTGLGAILTGMGRDGVEGLSAIHRAGGMVVAQDEASSVVFGMPRAAIQAGIVDCILPLDGIARHLVQAVGAAPS